MLHNAQAQSLVQGGACRASPARQRGESLAAGAAVVDRQRPGPKAARSPPRGQAAPCARLRQAAALAAGRLGHLRAPPHRHLQRRVRLLSGYSQHEHHPHRHTEHRILLHDTFSNT